MGQVRNGFTFNNCDMHNNNDELKKSANRDMAISVCVIAALLLIAIVLKMFGLM